MWLLIYHFHDSFKILLKLYGIHLMHLKWFTNSNHLFYRSKIMKSLLNAYISNHDFLIEIKRNRNRMRIEVQPE